MIEIMFISLLAIGLSIGYMFFKDKYLENNKTPFHKKLKIDT